MIDWLGVATNGMWVLGLTGMLAVWSYFEYFAKSHGQPVRQLLKVRAFIQSFSWAIAVFCAGVSASGGSWWQRLAWAVLAVLFGVQAWRAREPRL
jgi:hypothetical protein